MYSYSVIIPSYKRNVSTVQRAIQSVEAQTAQDYHIFLIDDNLNDSAYSCALKESFSSYPKLTYVKQDGNKGACAARNLGIELSECEFISFLDDDDTWEPNKAELQLNAFSKEIGMVYCLGYLLEQKGNEYEKKDYYTANHFKKEVTFQDLLLFDHLGSTTQAMVRKSCIQQCGAFAVGLPARQDYEMWLRISRVAKIVGVEQKLFTHFVYEGERITGNPRKALAGFQYVYQEFRTEYRKNPKANKVMLRWLSNAAKKSHSFLYIIYRTKLLFL